MHAWKYATEIFQIMWFWIWLMMAVDGLAFPHLEKVLKLHFHSFAHGDFSRAQSRESYHVGQKKWLISGNLAIWIVHVLKKCYFNVFEFHERGKWEIRYAVHFEHGLAMIFLQDSVCLSAVSLSRQRHDILDFSCCPLSRVLHVTLANWQRFGFEFHLRLSPSAFSGYDQLITSLFATPCWRDPTRSTQLSTIAILGFQFGLYPVVAPLSFLRCISFASFFVSVGFRRPPCRRSRECSPAWLVSIQMNLYKFELQKFVLISRLKKKKLAVTWIMARVFAYLPCFFYQILDFIYWTVLIFILIYFGWRDNENQQQPFYQKGHCIFSRGRGRGTGRGRERSGKQPRWVLRVGLLVTEM